MFGFNLYLATTFSAQSDTEFIHNSSKNFPRYVYMYVWLIMYLR